MPRKHLTAKQYEFLHFLRRFVQQNHGVWPTYREITEYFDYRSPNSVTQNLQALARKGYLTRHGEQYALVDDRAAPRGIPVMGTITAGGLQEAVEENLGTITLETLFPSLHRIFALRVRGQSMQGADIHDGDYVLLVDDDIPQGGIGAVLYEGETTLKRVFMDDGGGLRLEPCNEEYEAIRITPDVFEEVKVLGRYVGHVNRTGIHRRGTSAYAKAA